MLTKDSAKLNFEAKEKLREIKAEWQHNQVKMQRARDAETIATDAGRNVTNFKEQIGRPLHGNEIRRLLKTLNTNLRFEIAKADPAVTGIYIGRKFICGMMTNETPEFTVRFSPTGFVMRGEMRGWRTVLAKLIRKHIIGMTEAENLFHINSSSTESANWQRLAK